MKTSEDIFRETSLTVLSQADEYRMPEVPENVKNVLYLIRKELDLQQAQALSEKAVKKMQIMCLGYWAKGIAKGPQNARPRDFAKTSHEESRKAGSSGVEEDAGAD